MLMLYRSLAGITLGSPVRRALDAAHVPHLLAGLAPHVARAQVGGALEELVGRAVLGLANSRLDVGDGGAAR